MSLARWLYKETSAGPARRNRRRGIAMSNIVVKAAVVQAAPVVFETLRTVEKLRDLTRDAAAQGAALVVFPEAFVGGYPKGLDFGARLGQRSEAGREDFRRYFESAIE